LVNAFTFKSPRKFFTAPTVLSKQLFFTFVNKLLDSLAHLTKNPLPLRSSQLRPADFLDAGVRFPNGQKSHHSSFSPIFLAFTSKAMPLFLTIAIQTWSQKSEVLFTTESESRIIDRSGQKRLSGVPGKTKHTCLSTSRLCLHLDCTVFF